MNEDTLYLSMWVWSPTDLFGIHLALTELLDSAVRMEFSTGLFQAVFIWLSMEFSSSCGDQHV